MATLTATDIVRETMEAFKARVPQLNTFSFTPSANRVKQGQTLTGHIRSVPTVGNYGSTSGYFENGQEGESLLADVNVTASEHKHCTVSLSHLNAISDTKRVEFLGDQAYALGKSMVDYCLGLVLATNFSESTTEANADVDSDTLRKVRTAMAKRKANLDNINGIASIDFMDSLSEDQRISSRDYFGQLPGTGSRVYRGVEGIASVMEYADMPTNSENLSAFFYDPRAIVLATGLPADSLELAAQYGAPPIANAQVMTDSETGFSMLYIVHQQPGKLDLFLTMATVYGAAAGKRTGSNGTICDYAGHRVKTA